jgi:3',5'-cyclic AMP phosphodiesterase CpdA
VERAGGRRPRWAVLAVVAVVLAVVATVLVLSPPAVLRQLGAEDRPSPVSGEPVPLVARRPVVRIAVAGDTGTGDAAERATVRRMTEEGRGDPYDALVLLGDLIYEDGDADLARSRVLQAFRPVLDAGAELVPVLGNHDYESGEQQQILEALGRERSWYVERVGPVRLVVLDSNRVEYQAQTAWLGRVLATTPRRTWTIVAMHHPAYSAGYHGSDMEVRDRWSGLFTEAGVPLVLAGHDHDYQRSTPQDGVTYVVSGAGAKLRKTGHEDFTAVSASVLHYLDLLVYRDRIVARAIDHQGRLLDSFTIRRGGPLQ